MHTIDTTPATELTDTQAEAVAQADAFVTNAGLPSYSHLLRLWLASPVTDDDQAGRMWAVITDRHGQEVTRYELEDTDPLSCDHFAKMWAEAAGVTLAEPDGLIPDGCEDFAVTLTDQPGAARCWNSQNYMIEADQ